MVDYRAKFDSELRDIHTSFLDLRSGNQDRVYPIHSVALHGGPVSLLLQFGDDLAGIEARGFRTRWVEGNFARGDVELADLEAVASHSEVIRLEYGAEFRPLLDTSVVNITVREKVWSLTFETKPDGTKTAKFNGHAGAGMLIGIIDTGIDIRHPVFLKQGSTDTTRILRIWDMGIPPHDTVKGPDPSLLPGGSTYGVEYTDKMINDVLQKGSKLVKHKDCHGHGTHVASIAAGDGRAGRGKDKKKETYKFVGVAPAADLIVVKMFYLREDPMRNGTVIPHEERIEDAIAYIDRVAKTEQLKDRPVVINVSLGAEVGAHDGLTAADLLLETLFRNTSKRALVAAAGNEGNPKDPRQHAVITMPAGDKLDVPFTLYDERTPKTALLAPKDESHCDRRDNARPELKIQFWYPQLGPQKTLTFKLALPGGKPPISGPALGSKVEGTYGKGFKYYVSHEAETTRRPPANTPLTRNVVRIKVTPKESKSGNKSFGVGRFTLQLNAPRDTVIHAWGEPGSPPHGFRMGHDNAIDPAEMRRSNLSTLSFPGTSAGAITVAAYNDDDENIYEDSSRGLLVHYSGSGPYVEKPDLAAPGENIEAATGETSLLRRLAQLFGLGRAPYGSFSGTSAAAPHVAGVAALMFQKKPSLTQADLVKKLKDNVRPPQPPDGDTFGKGMVDGAKSHGAV
jgi:subtilisin family serine protease